MVLNNKIIEGMTSNNDNKQKPMVKAGMYLIIGVVAMFILTSIVVNIKTIFF